MSLRDVCALVFDPVPAFELGVVCEVFGLDRSAQGLPRFEFEVVSGSPGPLTGPGGLRLHVGTDLGRLDSADLICVPSWHGYDTRPPEPVLTALRAAVARGSTVLSVCSGAFVLAAAGLLDGQRATTHWMHVQALAVRYPDVTVEPDVLYVDGGQVVTSAGTAAGIDACLHVVRREFGTATANAIARRMVVPAHRGGRQAQFVEAPVPDQRRAGADTLAALMDWAVANLGSDLSISALAARAHMSERTLARRFRETTGTTPYQWVLAQRTAHARQLLEEGLPVDAAARASGFSGASALRAQFSRENGTPPSVYARAFRTAV